MTKTSNLNKPKIIMKQLKTILNKKLFFLFFVLGSAMGVQAQTNQSITETFCQGFSTVRNYAIDTVEGPNGTPGSTYTWSVTGPNSGTAVLSASIGNPITINWASAPSGSYIVHVLETNNGCPAALEVTLNVVITPLATPAFTQVSAICSGATLTALPTTSINGITGTWSPALDNTATTTYTFTPTTGQCATTTTMTITVNPNIAPAFTQVSAICSGATLTALPTTSTNGITGTWSPALDNTATTTYTFTPTTGECAATASMIITVNPLPTTSNIFHD